MHDPPWRLALFLLREQWVPCLPHWPQCIGVGQTLDSVWVNLNSLLLKSWIWTLNDIGGHWKLSWEKWLLFILWVRVRPSRKETGALQPMGPGEAESRPLVLTSSSWFPAPHEAWVNILPWGPGDLCVSAPRFSFLHKLNDWVLLLEIKVFLIKVLMFTPQYGLCAKDMECGLGTFR